MKIGVLLPNWVGDAVMATPLLRTLREHHPAAEIVGIGRPYLMPLLEGLPLLDRFMAWEHRGPGWLGRTWHVIHALRAWRPDVVLTLRNSPLAACVARASGAPQTVGYARRGAGLMLTTALEPPRWKGKLTPTSAVDYFLALGEAVGCMPRSKHVELATTPSDLAAADNVWSRLQLPNPEHVVLLNTGGAYGSAKHWPREHSIALARRMATELDLAVLVLCGPDEQLEAAAIADSANHPHVHSMAGEDLSFGTTKAIISRSRLLISTDSGPRHMAAALGTPTITLFGPIDPRWSENYQPGAVHLRLPLECSPCGKRVCPLGHHRCMRDLSVDMVCGAALKLLSTKPLLQVA